jgi:hypothetical protein
MSRLMQIAGILMVAAAIALLLMIFFSLSSLVAWGITPELAVELLVGGILAIGLGSLISALEAGHTSVAGEQAASAAPVFGRAAPAAATSEAVSAQVTETIKALEQAKVELRQAIGEEETTATEAPATASATEEAPAAEEAPASEEAQLYVVEERPIRGRSARILSDGTVEAETDEGWMRFENLEHLDEYLDATTPSQPR